MPPLRILFPLLLPLPLLACGDRPPGAASGFRAPIDAPVVSSELPPPDAADGASASASGGEWRPYAARPRRSGTWNGKSAWSHPPRPTARPVVANSVVANPVVANNSVVAVAPLPPPTPPEPASGAAAPRDVPPPPAVPAAGAIEGEWAERWVPAGDRTAFDGAVEAALSRGEGRWRSADGRFGVAFPGGDGKGKCRSVEVILSDAEGGLPIRSRGTVLACR